MKATPVAAISCTRDLQFCAGHRVMGHENKCAHLHGHNYNIEVTAAPLAALDKIGRVIDFSVLKSELGTWIDANWDHGFILNKSDQPAIEAISRFDQLAPSGLKQKLYLMSNNPTAENMARHLLFDICPKLFEPHGIRITSILVHETPNCRAEAKLL